MPVKILALIIHNFKSFRNEHTIKFSEATTFMGGSQSGECFNQSFIQLLTFYFREN